MSRRRNSVHELSAQPEHASAGPDISALTACIEDTRRAALDGDDGPPSLTNFPELRGRLEAARTSFPPLYRENFVDPYVSRLDRLGQAGFTQVLIGDPQRESTAGLMLDMAQAILQRGDRFQCGRATPFRK
jgi:hypothetical protein